MDHVFWIGGGSGAGKSTVSARLAAEYDLDVYATDDVMPDHARRGDPAATPYLQQFAAMTMDERWLDRGPEVMLDTFHWYRGEGFDLMLDDLRALDRPVVAEGFRLLPELVAPLLTDVRRAVWLLPTPEFRRMALQSRGGLWKIAGQTSHPERALHNLLERDRMFTDRLARTTAELGLPVIPLDGSLSEDDVVRRIAAGFGLTTAARRGE